MKKIRTDIQESIGRLVTIEHGFTHQQAEAERIFRSMAIDECLTLAHELLKHEACQVRALAVFLLGHMAATRPAALMILKEQVSGDPNWRVQEILAKAFDRFCKETGYQKALPVIREWLGDARPNVCRAVTEGLRIWVARPYFDEHPQAALDLIGQHRASDSEYLRKSVGNAIKDIGKTHPELVRQALATWSLDDKRVAFTYRYASKKLKP